MVPVFVSDHWFFLFRSELVPLATLEQPETLGTSSGQWLSRECEWWVVKVIRRRHWLLGISSGHWAMREAGCLGYTEETNLIPSSHGHCIRAPLEPEAGKWDIIFESRSSVGPVG